MKYNHAVLILALVISVAIMQPVAVHGQSGYSSGSWAIGVVIPENSELSNGEMVNWNDVSNVSAVFNLPNISSTDSTIYVIMSLMTENGSIIQLAAGLYSNASYWLTYAMYVLNPNSYPQVYKRVSISDDNFMLANDLISMSMYFSNGRWQFKVNDLTRGTSTVSYFNVSLPAKLKDGDQYVFALESYSYNSSVFKSMSRMTLYGLFVDGKRVSSGWYLYTTWNNQNFPLFIVGGSTPPDFISASFSGNDTVTWSYVSAWASGRASYSSFYLIGGILVAAAAVINISVLMIMILKRRKWLRRG
ncbi:MAG: hypothetical protein ACP5NC_06050 [Nitrososphaeria archaeon]